MKSKSRKTRLLRIVSGLAVLALSLLFSCYFFSHQILTVDDGPAKADVIVVLGGGPERPGRAADLFLQEDARKILVSGAGDCRANEQMLERRGIAASEILLECNSRSTIENARFSIAKLRELGAHRVIIVTSWYHSRRALNSFRHLAPDIVFISRPAPGATPAESHWPGRYERRYVIVEYIKLLGYWAFYGVSPVT